MRILLVEDDAVLRDVMLRSLSDVGHRVDIAASLDEARHWWRVQTYDSVLLDLNLPITLSQPAQGNGLTVLREARARGAQYATFRLQKIPALLPVRVKQCLAGCQTA